MGRLHFGQYFFFDNMRNMNSRLSIEGTKNSTTCSIPSEYTIENNFNQQQDNNMLVGSISTNNTLSFDGGMGLRGAGGCFNLANGTRSPSNHNNEMEFSSLDHASLHQPQTANYFRFAPRRYSMPVISNAGSSGVIVNNDNPNHDVGIGNHQSLPVQSSHSVLQHRNCDSQQQQFMHNNNQGGVSNLSGHHKFRRNNFNPRFGHSGQNLLTHSNDLRNRPHSTHVMTTTSLHNNVGHTLTSDAHFQNSPNSVHEISMHSGSLHRNNQQQNVQHRCGMNVYGNNMQNSSHGQQMQGIGGFSSMHSSSTHENVYRRHSSEGPYLQSTNVHTTTRSIHNPPPMTMTFFQTDMNDLSSHSVRSFHSDNNTADFEINPEPINFQNSAGDLDLNSNSEHDPIDVSEFRPSLHQQQQQQQQKQQTCSQFPTARQQQQQLQQQKFNQQQQRFSQQPDNSIASSLQNYQIVMPQSYVSSNVVHEEEKSSDTTSTAEHRLFSVFAHSSNKRVPIEHTLTPQSKRPRMIRPLVLQPESILTLGGIPSFRQQRHPNVINRMRQYGKNLKTEALLHKSCRHYASSMSVVESALHLDPSGIRRSIPTLCVDKGGESKKNCIGEATQQEPKSVKSSSPTSTHKGGATPTTRSRGKGNDKKIIGVAMYEKRVEKEIYCFPINIALKCGAGIDVIKLLAQAGPDVLVLEDGPDQMDSLSIALKMGYNLDVVKILVAANREVCEFIDVNLNTVLHMAMRSVPISKENVHFLYQRKPDALMHRNLNGDTPLDIATHIVHCPDDLINYLHDLMFELDDAKSLLLLDQI